MAANDPPVRDDYAAFFKRDLERLLRDTAAAWSERVRGSGLLWTPVEVDLVVDARSFRLRRRSGDPGAEGDPPVIADKSVQRRNPAAGVQRDPTGNREAIRRVLAEAGEPLRVPDLAAALEERGVVVKTGALHQLLGRMVRAGEIERPARGSYRSSPDSRRNGGSRLPEA
jgi:hypothetical protein